MTTTATERPTLSTTEARALPAGTRVEWREYSHREDWHPGVIADPDTLLRSVSAEERNRYALIRSGDETGWRDGDGRYWWANDNDLIRVVDAFIFGDRVQFTRGSRTYTGTVVGRYAPTPTDRSWLVADEGLPTDSDPYAYRRGPDSLSGGDFTYVWPEGADRLLSAWLAESDLTRVTDAPEVPTPVASNNDEAERILRMIGEAMAETSDRHEWCGEYERILDRLVDSLPYGHLRDVFSDAAHRDRDFTVYVEVNVSTRVPVTVSASSPEAAVETVQDDPWAYIDTYTLRNSLDSDDVEFGDVECD